jgi:hypothetical protein
VRTVEPPRPRSKSRAWPIGITIGLIVVVLVNLTFIVIAVRGADPVAESYEAGER